MKKLASFGFVALILGAVAYGVMQMPGILDSGDGSDDVKAAYVVQRRTIEDRVVERGTIESQKTVYGKCEIPGRNKITFIVPEGTQVKEGDKVAEFETTEIDKDIKQQGGRSQ